MKPLFLLIRSYVHGALWIILSLNGVSSAPSDETMMDASCVRLLDGPFKQRQELHRTGYLADFDVDRLLFPYRNAAGITQPVGVISGYSGWDAGFIRGHMAGHYLSAASRMYAATGDTTFRDKANALVDGLAVCQNKFRSGHLAAFPEDVLSQFEQTGKISHGILVPYYTIHKIISGLLDAHHYLHNPKALELAEKMADCYAKRMAALSPDQIDNLLRTDRQRNPVNEFGGMSDCLTELAHASHHERHLTLARIFIRDWFTQPLAANEDRLENLHANTHVAQVVGIAHYAHATNDKNLSLAAANFWRFVTRSHSFVNGGNSFKEWFDKPNRETTRCIDDGNILPYNTAETCNAHNMLKLTRQLIESETDTKQRAEYGDFYERALYNDILSSIAPDTGRVIYFHPLFGDFKTYLKGTECCEGSGIENTARYGEGIYFKNADSLLVNLYIPSVVQWKEKGITIKQDGNIPWQKTVTFTISKADTPVPATIRLRVPRWLTNQPHFQIIGESQMIGDTPEISIQRTWKTGDQFTLDLTPALRLVQPKDNPQIASLTYGPLVLAARLGTDGMPPDIGDKDLARTIPRPETPTIIGKSEDPSLWMQLLDPATLTFQAHDCGPASGYLFQPVHDVHHERFSVYLPIQAPSKSN